VLTQTKLFASIFHLPRFHSPFPSKFPPIRRGPQTSSSHLFKSQTPQIRCGPSRTLKQIATCRYPRRPLFLKASQYNPSEHFWVPLSVLCFFFVFFFFFFCCPFMPYKRRVIPFPDDPTFATQTCLSGDFCAFPSNAHSLMIAKTFHQKTLITPPPPFFPRVLYGRLIFLLLLLATSIHSYASPHVRQDKPRHSGLLATICYSGDPFIFNPISN